MPPLKKQINIIEFAISSLVRRRYKSAAILFAYVLIVALIASVLFTTHSLRVESAAILQSTPDLVVQRLSGGRHELIPLAYGEEIKSILGVSKLSPRYWGYYYDALAQANYTLIGAGEGPPELRLLEGKLPTSAEECAIGSGVAALRGAGTSGELIMINSRNQGTLFHVSGIFKSASNLLTNDLVVLTDQAVIDFFAFPPGMATDLAVQVPNSREVPTIAAKVKRLFPDARPITKQEILRTYDTVFNWRSGMMLTVFSTAVIAFCILAWDKATGISAEEKKEMGILKAIGWDTGDVIVLKFWEGLLLSLSAVLTGIIIGYIHVFVFGAPLLAAILKGWSVLFPPFALTPTVDPLHVLLLFFFTVTPYMACTVLPIWKTAVTDPDTVMRGQ